MNDNPDFYAKFYKNESKTAAYLDYITIEDFRKLRFHSTSLFWYIALHERCKARESKTSLSILRHANSTMFESNLNELIVKYPMRDETEDRLIRHANNVHKDHIYAEILWHFARELENLPKFIKDEIIYLHDCFEKLLSFDCKLSEFDIADVIAPTLSSLPDEVDLKRYSRVNALLKFMQCVLASSRWRETFEKKHADSFSSSTIAADFISIWMRPNQEQKKSLISKPSTEKQKRTLKNITLQLKRVKFKWERELCNHEREFLEDEGLSLSNRDILDKDPRDYPIKSMWRDTIRRKLNYEKLRMNFLKIYLDSTHIFFNAPKPEKIQPWTNFQNRFNDEIMNHIIHYTLQMIEIDEEYSYEYEESSLTLMNDVQLFTDNDSILKKNDQINEAT